MQTTKPTHLALIGFGYWGKKCFSTINSIPNVTIHYLVTSQTHLNLDSSITILTHWTQLLTSSNVDGVIIAAPSNMHYEIAKAFIKQNIPVFIEKPMTLSTTQATELVTLAKQYQSKVLVDHILLYSPAFQAMKTFVKQHKQPIKRIHMISGKWTPYPEHVSVLWEWAPHEIAMCFDLFNHDIQTHSVSTTQRNFKSTYGQTIDFTGSVNTIPLTISWSNLRKRPVRQVVITYDDKQLIFDDKVDNKLAILDKDNCKTLLTYPDNLALTVAFETFALMINQPTIDYHDVNLGAKVVSFIEHLSKR